MSVLIWVQTVCKDYQKMTKVAASKKRAICKSQLNKLSVVVVVVVVKFSP